MTYGRGLPVDVSHYSSAEVPDSGVWRVVVPYHLPEALQLLDFVLGCG
jgi:hypothetical protein